MSKVDIRIDRGPAAAGKARHALDRLARQLEPDLLYDLRLLVTEMVTNSVRHGRSGPGGSVHLRINLTRSKVRVEVRDPGPGFAESRNPQPAEDRASGWGLVLVDKLADRWGVDRKRGTLVWFEVGR